MSQADPDIIETLFNSALDLLCVGNKDGYLIKLNPSWSRHLGWSDEELLSKPFIEFIHDGDRIATQGAFDELYSGAPEISFESRFQVKEGRYHWLQWRLHLGGEDGKTVFGVVRDITQAKHDQIRSDNDIHLLEMSEQTAHVGHWRMDSASGELDWSNEVFNIFGRKPNKSIIRLDDFLDGFIAKDERKLWFAIERAVQDGSEIDLDLTLVRPDGELRNVIIRAFCEKGPSNLTVGLFGIIQDVTAERQQQKNMREKEELMSMAFKATSDGIWDWDLLSDKVWYSPQWKFQFGYEDYELRNTPAIWKDLIFDEDREEAEQALLSHLKGDSERFEMVQRYRHKLGHTVFVLSRGYAVRDETGRAIRFVGAHTDITELKRLEQAKSEFTSVVSHELRTPLTAIHGAIGLVNGQFKDELPDAVQGLMKIANNNSERLILLVNDILDMEKLQSGRLDFDLRPITLEEFLPQAIENHQALARQYHVTLSLQNKLMDARVMADGDRLMQVLANLLSNAIKFSHSGDTVKILVQQNEQNITLSVIDTGRGIPIDMLDKIFDKFIQADSSDNRHKGGTGLGLSISKAMMEHMNGSISVISKFKEGSTFTISLPKC